jgi:hypothetical protein
MYEAIITLALVNENIGHLETVVWRIKFDNEEAMEEAMEALRTHRGVLNAEQLTAN